MRYLRALGGLLVLAAATGTGHAADPNGYIARYECRAGGPQCNVDVAGLAARACDQIINPSTSPTDSWPIDFSKSVICIAEGDHSSRGVLRLTASGTSANRKILRYYSGSDANDDPWKQQRRAKIAKLSLEGSYWLIHRLSIDGNDTRQDGVFIKQGADNNIISRVLVERHFSSQIMVDWNGISSNNRIQNSVIRKAALDTAGESQCIDIQKSQYLYFVNNETYDCHKSFAIGDGVIDTRGVVVENNDIYVSKDFYSDCRGNFNGTGPCSGSEAVMSLKAGGTSSAPAVYIQNRIWGGRTGDAVLLGSDNVGGGEAVTLSGNPAGQADWVMFRNNIIMDSQYGIAGYWGPGNNNSIIGNLVYRIRQFDTRWGTNALWMSSKQYSEVYLNSIIDADTWLEITGSSYSGGTDLENDIRCNVVIAGRRVGETGVGAGTQVGNNAFYGSPSFARNAPTGPEMTLRTRASSTNYAVGDILATGSSDACRSSGDSTCYLYKVITPGTTASGSPGYCTQLGCISTDGGVTVQAVRGPYTFYRKLRTGPEQAVIPYARVHTAAPEAYSCPMTYASRRGVGVNDDQ